MKTSIMAFAALLGHTSAQNFLIINSCSTPVYFQPILSNGDTSGPLNTVQPGQSWSEVYRPDGSVRISHIVRHKQVAQAGLTGLPDCQNWHEQDT